MNFENKLVVVHAVVFFVVVGGLIIFNNFYLEANANNLFIDNVNNTKVQEIQDVEENISIKHLEGTCPRDRFCFRPSCVLWSDINKDGVCDRG